MLIAYNTDVLCCPALLLPMYMRHQLPFLGGLCFTTTAPGAETFEGVCRKVELRLDELHDMLAPYSRAMQPVKTRHSGFFDIGHWRGLGQAKKVQ